VPVVLKNKAVIFKALSEPNRLRILKMLQMKSLCVCEITNILKLAPSTVSKHLSILKDAGFIIEEKDGKWMNYMLNSKPDDATLASVVSMMHLWLEDADEIKKDRRAVNKVDRLILCK
jgi:ArsR family transcriptional regulator